MDITASSECVLVIHASKHELQMIERDLEDLHRNETLSDEGKQLLDKIQIITVE